MAEEILTDGGNHRRVQQRSPRRDGWTKARRVAFLKALAETCNVRLASERAGMAPTGIYRVRHRDPAFAVLWDEALAIGYDRLEALLLQRALEGVDEIDVAALIDDDAPITRESRPADSDEAPAGQRRSGSPIPSGVARADVQLALALLNRRGAKEGLRARGRKVMNSDEVDALLTRKLDALARRRADAGRGPA